MNDTLERILITTVIAVLVGLPILEITIWDGNLYDGMRFFALGASSIVLLLSLFSFAWTIRSLFLSITDKSSNTVNTILYGSVMRAIATQVLLLWLMSETYGRIGEETLTPATPVLILCSILMFLAWSLIDRVLIYRQTRTARDLIQAMLTRDK